MKKKNSLKRSLVDAKTAKTIEEFYTSDKNNISFWLAKMERYDKGKVFSSCLKSGVDEKTAEAIAKEVDRYVDSRMKMSDVRPLIFALLQKHNADAAKRFKAGEIYVRTSSEKFERFDREKIAKSLLKETEIAAADAEQIAFETEKFIRAANLDCISSSLVREIVNAKLIEHGLEKIRSQYTRIGMPLYDITELINIGSNENANLQQNPETIHKLIADSVLREYALMKVIPKYATDAHLHGLIHIHDLDYFVSRPFCFSHDLRFFLKKGYYADGQGIHTAAAGPAKHAEVAILHAAKILASAQTNSGGGQGYNWFNTLLAPYLRGFDYKKMKQMAQMFLFEMSQMYVARGGQTVFSSIDIDPTVPKILENIPAVQPGGVVSESTTYADYYDEANKFFRALIDVYTQGDAIGKPFNFPKCEVKVSAKDFESHKQEMEAVSALAAKFGTPYFFVQQPYMPEFSCYQCCAYLMPLSDQNTQDDLHNGTVRGGALQVVTINLPRIAYDAGGDDSRLYELLRERMEIARDVHLVKQKIMKQRLSQGLLPFLAQPIDERGTQYLNVDKQSLEIGMVGLNEMLKAHAGLELHEQGALPLGLKIIKAMTDIAKEFSQETAANFVVSRTPAESCAHRLALIDLKELNGKAIVQGDKDRKSIYYTNGNHVRPSADIPLLERLKLEASFCPLLLGGTMSHIWLGEAHPDPTALTSLTEKIVKKTLTAYYAYTKDLTVCKDCKFVAPNLLKACPKCSSKNVDGYSRITGYYQKVSGWNSGKLQELQDRRRYNLPQ